MRKVGKVLGLCGDEQFEGVMLGSAMLSHFSCVRPHRRQPTRLPHPWDSPGKNTGLGCYFLLQCVKVKLLSRVRPSATHGLQPSRLLRPWDSPGKSTGVGCHWGSHIMVVAKYGSPPDFTSEVLVSKFWLCKISRNNF